MAPSLTSYALVERWWKVATDVVILLRSSDDLSDDLQDRLTTIFSDSDVVAAWGSCQDEPKSRRPGLFPASECLGEVVEAQAMGPLALRAISPDTLSPDLSFSPFTHVLSAMTSGLVHVSELSFTDSSKNSEDLVPVNVRETWRDPSRLRPFGNRRRWHEPSETVAWLDAVDALAAEQRQSIQQELTVTTALLRRIVLLPDLAELGPMASFGMLVIDTLAARMESLVMGLPPDRSPVALALIDAGCDIEALPKSWWWNHQALDGSSLRYIGQSAILAGPETNDQELERFKVTMERQS